MYEFVAAKRKSDAVISVCQDNESKTIEVIKLNKAIEDLLGYKKEKLLHKPLTSILCSNSTDCIENYLEYSASGNDLSDVLSKISNLSLIRGDGKEIRVKIKAFRTGNSTSNKINYELLICDLSLSHKLHIFRDQYLDGRKYTTHPDLEIMDERSTKLELDVILNFVNQHYINAVVGLVIPNSEQTLKTIIDSLQKNCRGEDIIGYLGNNRVIFILLGCEPQNSNNAVLRLYSQINQAVNLVGYADMFGENSSTELLNKIELALQAAQISHESQKCIRYTQAPIEISKFAED